MKLGKFGSFVAAVAAALYSTIAVGETYETSINLNVYDESVLTVAAGDTCKLKFTGATTTKKFSKEGNGNIEMSNLSFGLAQWYWKGAGTLTADDCTINVSGVFKSYGAWNEQSNVFNNCSLTAGTFSNDCDRNRLHTGTTIFNGGTYNFQKMYLTTSDSGYAGFIYVLGGAEVNVTTEFRGIATTSGGTTGNSGLIIEDATVTLPVAELSWGFVTEKSGHVSLLPDGTLKAQNVKGNKGADDYLLGNGGTFIVTKAGTDALPSQTAGALEHVYIGADGLTLSTDFANTTASASFEPWTNDDGLEENGSLTKVGTGTLTLTGDASAHDRTIVAEGTLKFGAAVQTHPGVEVAGGATLDFTGATATLNSLSVGDESAGVIKLTAAETIVLTEPDSFNPVNIALDVPDITTAGTVYTVVREPGQVTSGAAEAWEAMSLPELPGMLRTFKAVYDADADETSFVLSIEKDMNVKHQITVNAEKGGSVDFESGKYLVETPISLTAVPDAGCAFIGWAGDVEAGHERDNPLEFTVSKDREVTARFGKITYVEWLGSTAGGGQYIDTGYVIKSAPTLETTMMVKTVSYGSDAAGTPKNAVGTNAGDFRLNMDLDRGYIWYYYGATGYLRVPGWKDTEAWYECSFGKDVYVNGKLQWKEADLKPDWSFEGNTAPLYLFAGQSYCEVRFKETKLTVDGETVFDLLPAKIGDEPCMIDTLTGAVFFNAGTGAFETGPRIVPSLAVEHNPTGLGVSNPPEGALDDPDPDVDYTFTAVARDDLPDGVAVKVLGCDLLRKNASGEYEVVDSGGETGSYTFFHSADEKVVWNFETSYRVTAASADVTLGSVDKAEQWVAHGGNVTVTAVPVKAGYAFAGWTGAPEGMERVNPLTFAVEAPWNLVANFISDSMDVEIDLSSGDKEVEIPFGRTGTLIGFTGNASANLTLKGGGTLKMGGFGTSGDTFANLVLDGCVIEVGSIAQLGTGTITASNGGGIRVTGDVDLKTKKFTVSDACTFDVSEGVKLTLHAPYYAGSGATLVKKGGGTLHATMDSSATTFPASGHWLIEGGTLTTGRGSNASSAFMFDETVRSDLVAEVLEGATLSNQGVLPVVILRGGRLTCTANGYATGTGDVADRVAMSAKTAPTGPMLNGGLYVYPSESGAPSVVDSSMLHLSQVDRESTEIFVSEGAELDVKGTLAVRKQSAGDVDYGTVRKTGGGVLRLFRPVAVEGVLRVEAGTVALVEDIVFDSDKLTVVGAGGKVLLSDGSMLALSEPDPVLSSAEVWVDASRAVEADGTKPVRITNYGTIGGGLAYSGTDGSQLSVAENAVGGLAAYRAGGFQGAWMRYSNDGSAMTTFVVARNNSWADAGGKGKGGSPIQIGGDGNPGAPALLHYDFSAANAFKVAFGSVVQTFTDQGVSPGETDLFLNETVWSGTAGSFRQYWSDETDPLTWTGTVTDFPSGKFTRLSLGCKMYSNGIYCRGSNAMVGDVCEVLVFNRVLSDDETAYVRSYLQRKWFGSTVAPVALPAEKPAEPLGVDVDAAATAAVRIGDNVQVCKGGAGQLLVTDAGVGSSGALLVEEGTLQVSTNGWRNYAAVWVDATDETTIEMDGERIASLANKGVLGGAFTPAVNYTGTEARPTLGAINGKTAISFGGAQGLWFDGFSLSGSRAETPVYVYMVAERTSFPSLGARSPFMLADRDCTALCADGTFYYDDASYKGANTKINLYAGKSTTQIVYDQADSNVPFLDVFELRDNLTFYSQMTADKSPDNGPRNVYTTVCEVSNKVNRVILGGSYKNGKLFGEVKAGHDTDYAWDGRIGEFIVVTKPLSYAEEKELLDYLYNKWIATEPKAVAALPRVLGGGSTAFAGGNVDLAFADGTAIDFESPAVMVNDLVFGCDLSLWYAPVPAKGGLGGIFAYDGEVEGFDSKKWTVTGGPRVRGKLGVVNEPGLIALDYKKNGLSVLVR